MLSPGGNIQTAGALAGIEAGYLHIYYNMAIAAGYFTL